MPEKNDKEYKEGLRRAAALCGKQEQCSSQVREKLDRWGISSDTAERILESLKAEKFLDDSRYATYFVRDKFKLNAWGRIKIGVLLKRKGIEEAIIREALREIDEESYIGTCTRLIREKARSLQESSAYARKGKLFRFAAGRGFESDLIHRILDSEENL